MREFKFIRSLYKDENIFSTYEKSSCLFAYDKNGDIVDFDTKNDKTFQKRFADLSNEQRLSEIYTLKPNQFTVGATGVPGGSYSFAFTANTKVEDDSTDFPEKVKTSAEKNLNENTTETYNTINSKPKLNLTGKAAEKTGVTFTFGEKNFTRNFVFNVTGYLKERGYILANGANVNEAYPTDDNGVIDFGNNGDTAITNETFKDGFLQKIVSPTPKTIISTEKIIVTDENYGNLDIAMSYIPKDGFKLVVGDRQIVNSLDYSDNLNFFLYSETAPESDDSVTDNGTTYYRVGKCIVTPRSDTTIVKNYAKSYENNYIFDNATDSFRQVEAEDLLSSSINVYIGNEYNIIDGHVYKNDPTNTTKYVTFSEDWRENVDITAANATVDNDKGVVSPLITEHIFRQITDINVIATQSDD